MTKQSILFISLFCLTYYDLFSQIKDSSLVKTNTIFSEFGGA
jgi:hypothetical protein